MPGTLRALATIFAVLSLAFAAPALADDWQGNDWTPTPQDGQTWDPGQGDPAADPGAGDTGQASDPSQGSDPSQDGGWSGDDPGAQGWDPSQGQDPNQGQDPSQGQDPNQTGSGQGDQGSWPSGPGAWPGDGNGDHGRNPWYAPPLPTTKAHSVKGKAAMLRTDGKAAIPRGAPASVRLIIEAANQIIGKRYKWGGGHGRLFDSGYDCSGSVSYALIRAGELGYAMVSGTFARWGVRGAGKYVTIYANRGHVYMEVAGLRLDTSAVGDPSGKSGVRWRPPIGRRPGFAVRHIAGL